MMFKLKKVKRKYLKYSDRPGSYVGLTFNHGNESPSWRIVEYDQHGMYHRTKVSCEKGGLHEIHTGHTYSHSEVTRLIKEGKWKLKILPDVQD